MFVNPARTGSSIRRSSSSLSADETRSPIMSSIHCTAPVVTIKVRQRSMASSSRSPAVHQLGELPAGGRIGQVVCGDDHAGGLAFDQILAAWLAGHRLGAEDPQQVVAQLEGFAHRFAVAAQRAETVRSLQPLIAAPISNGRRTV